MHGIREIREANEAPNEAEIVRGVRHYVRDAVRGFINDHPDTDFQRGYLAALLAVAKEGFREDFDLPVYADAEAILNFKTQEVEGQDASGAVGPWSCWPRRCF